MAYKTLTVRYNSFATVTYKLTTFRNESAPDTAVDITGYAFYLTAKPSLEVADSRAYFNLAGAIVSATAGTFSFTLTPEHTAIAPGTWPAEIRWYSGGAPATGVRPTDSWTVDFVVEYPIDDTA